MSVFRTICLIFIVAVAILSLAHSCEVITTCDGDAVRGLFKMECIER